ncbi:MAG: hypothetical protein V4467_01315 [Patescibacteria group bacterium]
MSSDHTFEKKKNLSIRGGSFVYDTDSSPLIPDLQKKSVALVSEISEKRKVASTIKKTNFKWKTGMAALVVSAGLIFGIFSIDQSDVSSLTVRLESAASAISLQKVSPVSKFLKYAHVGLSTVSSEFLDLYQGTGIALVQLSEDSLRVFGPFSAPSTNLAAVASK